MAKLQLMSWGAYVGDRLKVYGRIRVVNTGHLVIGDEVTLVSGRYNPVGIDHSINLFCSGELVIMDHSGLSGATVVATRRVQIGERVLIGGGTQIYDTDFHALRPEDRIAGQGGKSSSVTIESDVFIGAYSMILKGAHIGQGAIIGAGSIVTGDVPSREIWAGIPARRKGILP